jgi:hypothetical protein
MARKPQPVQYLSFACSSAGSFWLDVCRPSQEQFFKTPGRLTAIQAAWPTWHVHYWLWHEKNRGHETRNNPAYKKFRDDLEADCPELGWLSDVTDASKHCGLSRSTDVGAVSGTGLHTEGQIFDVFGNRPHTQSDPLLLFVDGVPHNFADVLRAAIRYWETKYFK